MGNGTRQIQEINKIPTKYKTRQLTHTTPLKDFGKCKEKSKTFDLAIEQNRPSTSISNKKTNLKRSREQNKPSPAVSQWHWQSFGGGESLGRRRKIRMAMRVRLVVKARATERGWVVSQQWDWEWMRLWLVSEWVRVVLVSWRDKRQVVWLWAEMKWGIEILGFITIYIYIYKGILVYMYTIGSGRVWVWGFFLKPKPDSILYQAEHPRVGQKLSSLVVHVAFFCSLQ